MRTIMKWVSRGIIVLILLVFIAGALGYAILTRTIQPYSGEIDIAGLSAPVTIVRDKEGVPHIEAKTRDDALSALGFAHAQDRLWQMEVLRMSAQGRLSEMFGDATRKTDVFLRTLGFFEQAEQSLDVLSDETIAGLDAYARGVNAFIHRKTRLLEPSLAPEFLILGHAPEDWKPAHSVSALKMMSLNLSKNMTNELTRLAFAANGLLPNEIEDLFPTGPLDTPKPLPDLQKLYGLKKPVVTASVQSRSNDMMDQIMPSTGIWASNNWVVAGSRTESGKPLLGNDPHLAFNSPSLWYLAHVSFEDGPKNRNVIGASLPATPLILLGRTDNVAWGFTNAGADVQDVFIEEIKEDDKNKYRTPLGWQDFILKKEIIKIKGAEDFKYTRRISRHGPVLPGFYKDIDKMLPSKYVATLQWPGFSSKDTSMESALAIMNSETFDEYVDAVSQLLSPMQAMAIADTKGTIGLFAPASVPVRGADNDIEGRAPAPGWIEKYDWQGVIPVDELPLYRNPAPGAIATANSRFVGAEYKHHLTYDWEELFRHNRAQQLIVKANTKHTIASMKAAQADIYSPAFDKLRKILIENRGKVSPENIAVINRLKQWDAMMDRNLPEPLIMNSWVRVLVSAIYKDDLGSAFKAFNHQRATALIRLLEQGSARDWCDDNNTSRTEPCSEIIAKSFDQALSELREKFGNDPNKWVWGKAHKMYGEHRPFSKVWPLSLLFSVEVPSDGGRYTLNRGATKFNDKENPDRSVHGASYRAIYDFSDLDKSLFIHTTGQSGNFLSNLYSNMAGRWAKVEYLPMTTKPNEYGKEALGRWKLSPVK